MRDLAMGLAVVGGWVVLELVGSWARDAEVTAGREQQERRRRRGNGPTEREGWALAKEEDEEEALVGERRGRGSDGEDGEDDDEGRGGTLA